MVSLRARVFAVSAIFFSITMALCMVSLAAYEYHSSDGSVGDVYRLGVLLCFILNCSILTMLVHGSKTNNPNLLVPYIVLATFHAVVAVIGVIWLLGCTLHGMWIGDEQDEVYELSGLIVFIFLLFFWCWSRAVVIEERQMAQKLSGKHVIFMNQVDDV